MYETKMKELETDVAKKNQSITNLKQLLQEATEREHNIEKHTRDLKEQASHDKRILGLTQIV
ncbi:centrosomal protein 290 [Chelydra serpentina]|uniref:Centrosomal protein 290 n=1 Tax=Chelydra serpentina TaxID=8475 RepID=A0A8T1SN41_CHESE|nr:centrosomal protein 290 [Chelydra serpentina]